MLLFLLSFFHLSRDELFLGQRFSFFFVSLFSICCVSPNSELPTSPTRKLFQYTELGTENGPQQGLWIWGTCLVSKWADATDAGGWAVQVQGDQAPRKSLNKSHSVWLRSVVHSKTSREEFDSKVNYPAASAGSETVEHTTRWWRQVCRSRFRHQSEMGYSNPPISSLS